MKSFFILHEKNLLYCFAPCGSHSVRHPSVLLGQTNIEKLKLAELGKGKSYLDKYKMEIYLLYQEEWLATGSGYDNKIGALWVNPSTCQPVGSTIAHEIGHSFQYQVYCDKLCQGETDDLKSGFRYGYAGSNGGNGFWEQCAQWQSFQDYPEEMFTSYNFMYGLTTIIVILNMNGCAMPAIGCRPIGLLSMG